MNRPTTFPVPKNPTTTTLEINSRVHWNTGVGDGLFGRIVKLHSTPDRFGTMSIEWSGGQVSHHLPQQLLLTDQRWSCVIELELAA